MDQTRAGHRLDHCADGLAMDLLDSASEGLQRVDVGRNGELVEVLSVVAQQADARPVVPSRPGGRAPALSGERTAAGRARRY